MLVGEERVTASVGHVDGIEDRAEIRFFEERQVGVPASAEVHRVVGFGDDVEHLVVFAGGVDEGVCVEFAEPATERHLGFGIELLVAKHQHVVLVEGVANASDRGVAQVLCEVDAADFGAEQSGQWRKFHQAER